MAEAAEGADDNTADASVAKPDPGSERSMSATESPSATASSLSHRATPGKGSDMVMSAAAKLPVEVIEQYVGLGEQTTLSLKRTHTNAFLRMQSATPCRARDLCISDASQSPMEEGVRVTPPLRRPTLTMSILLCDPQCHHRSVCGR